MASLCVVPDQMASTEASTVFKRGYGIWKKKSYTHHAYKVEYGILQDDAHAA